MRIGHVRDQADSSGEEARVDVGAGNRGGEFLAEASADGRDVDPDLFENLAVHLRSDAAPPRRAVGLGAIPRRVVECGVAAGFALDVLECGADPGAERLEPVARGLLLVVERFHCGNPAVWRRASPSARAAAVARLRERTSARIGIRRIASQAEATSGGTPPLSLPSSKVSSGSKAKS